MRRWVKASKEAGDLFTEEHPDLGTNCSLCLVIRFLIFTFSFLQQVIHGSQDKRGPKEHTV